MKNHDLKRFLFTAGLGVVLTVGAGVAMGQTAGQDVKDAGHDTKSAAVDTGHATKTAAVDTKNGTKKAYHKTASGTKKAYHKTASGTKTAANKTADGAKDVGHGTENLGDRIVDKPATH